MKSFACSLCRVIVVSKFDIDMSGVRHLFGDCNGEGVLHEVPLSLSINYPVIIQPDGERLYQLPTGDLIAVKLFDDALADFVRRYPGVYREEKNDNPGASAE